MSVIYLLQHTVPASSDSAERVVLATKKNFDVESSTEGVDFFATVADVIEFLTKKEEPEEKEQRSIRRRTVTKLFDPTYSPSFRRQRRKKTPPVPVPKSPQVDLTWKEGRNHFPKKSSSIGEQFQATDIPEAGTFLDGKQDGSP